MKNRFWLILSLLPVAAFGAGNIEFNGLIVADGMTQVSLTNTDTGAYGWVPVGGVFSGYTIASFDDTKDQIILKKGSLNLPVKLKNAVIIEQAAPPTNQLNGPGGQGPSLAGNLRQINAAANQYFLATGKTSATMADLAPYLPAGTITPVNGESYTNLTVNQGQPISIANANGGTTTFVGGGGRGGLQGANNPATGAAPAGAQGAAVTTGGTATINVRARQTVNAPAPTGQ